MNKKISIAVEANLSDEGEHSPTECGHGKERNCDALPTPAKVKRQALIELPLELEEQPPLPLELEEQPEDIQEQEPSGPEAVALLLLELEEQPEDIKEQEPSGPAPTVDSFVDSFRGLCRQLE